MPGSSGQELSVNPLSAPSSTVYRRERLLRIGSHPGPSTRTKSRQPDDSPQDTSETPLIGQQQSYGTVPPIRKPSRRKSSLSFRFRRGLPEFPSLHLRPTISNPTTPLQSPGEFSFSHFSTQRPITAYDATLDPKNDGADPEEDLDAKINGIRVWYSSFSSIDWLHDAIKDSVRFSRLRKRKSLRARIRLAVDKSLGWFIVTIVGFLTAVVAFLVVRSEQWLFDSKEGYCQQAWWKAKRFCCPQIDDDSFGAPEASCAAWTTWADRFSPAGTREREVEFVEYIAYAIVAVSIYICRVLRVLTGYIVDPRYHFVPTYHLPHQFHNIRDA